MRVPYSVYSPIPAIQLLQARVLLLTLVYPRLHTRSPPVGPCPPARPCSFALLAKNNLSFDCHVNWFQLEEAAAFLARHPSTVTVIDHLGCPKLGQGEEEDAKRILTWRRGIAALAALPHVSVCVRSMTR